MELGDRQSAQPQTRGATKFQNPVTARPHHHTPQPWDPTTMGPHNLGTPNSRSHKISAPPNPGATVPEPWGHDTTGTQHPGGEGGRTSGSPRSQPRSESPCTPPSRPSPVQGGTTARTRPQKGTALGGLWDRGDGDGSSGEGIPRPHKLLQLGKPGSKEPGRARVCRGRCSGLGLLQPGRSGRPSQGPARPRRRHWEHWEHWEQPPGPRAGRVG